MTQNQIHQRIKDDAHRDISTIQKDLLPLFRLGFADDCSKIMNILNTISFKLNEKFPYISEGE